MTEAVCIHDSQGQHIGNICRPGPFKYQVAIHRRGSRTWEPYGKPTTIAQAFAMIGRFLQEQRRKAYRPYNRVGIWAVEQGESYYEPHQAYEVVVR